MFEEFSLRLNVGFALMFVVALSTVVWRFGRWLVMLLLERQEDSTEIWSMSLLVLAFSGMVYLAGHCTVEVMEKLLII